MSDLKIFFNTRIENSGFLSAVGNAGLAPLQYFCDGDTVKIDTESGHKITMHRRFHSDGDSCFRIAKGGDCTFRRMMETIAAVALLIPGLILSLFKLAAYISSDVREKHALLKERITETGRFTRLNLSIGSVENPIKTIEELERALKQEAMKDYKLTDALVIYGDGHLQIKEDPGILEFDPKKLILVGAELIHGTSDRGCLDEDLGSTGKWKMKMGRVMTAHKTAGGRTIAITNANSSLIEPKRVNTVDEALKAPDDKSGFLRTVYSVPLPSTT